MGYSLLSLTLAVTLETYKLPDSDEEVAEEEAIRRVLKQVRSGSCGLVYLPLNYSQCVCCLVSMQRMFFLFLGRVSFLPLWVLFQYQLPWAIQLQAIDIMTSSLPHYLSHSCLVSLVVCVSSPAPLCWYFLTCCFIFSPTQLEHGSWDVCCNT